MTKEMSLTIASLLVANTLMSGVQAEPSATSSEPVRPRLDVWPSLVMPLNPEDPVLRLTYFHVGGTKPLMLELPTKGELPAWGGVTVKIDDRMADRRFSRESTAATAGFSRLKSLKPNWHYTFKFRLSRVYTVPKDWKKIELVPIGITTLDGCIGALTLYRDRGSLRAEKFKLEDVLPHLKPILQRFERERKEAEKLDEKSGVPLSEDNKRNEGPRLDVWPSLVLPLNPAEPVVRLTYCYVRGTKPITLRLPVLSEVHNWDGLAIKINDKMPSVSFRGVGDILVRRQRKSLMPNAHYTLNLRLSSLWEIPNQWRKLEIVPLGITKVDGPVGVLTMYRDRRALEADRSNK